MARKTVLPSITASELRWLEDKCESAVEIERKRAEIILRRVVDQERTSEIATAVGVNCSTVNLVLHRAIDEGVRKAVEGHKPGEPHPKRGGPQPNSGAPRKLSPEQEKKIRDLYKTDHPVEGYWTLRRLAELNEVSHETVRQIVRGR